MTSPSDDEPEPTLDELMLDPVHVNVNCLVWLALIAICASGWWAAIAWLLRNWWWISLRLGGH